MAFCTNCRYDFFSGFTDYAFTAPTVLSANTENCPRCGSITAAPSGRSVPTPRGFRFIPAGAEATPLFNSSPPELFKQAYISIHSGKGILPPFKFWSSKTCLFIAPLCNEDVKVSLHGSGIDIIGFKAESARKGWHGSRVFYSRTRFAPYLAHAHRILRVEYDWSRLRVPVDHRSCLNDKQRSRLRLIYSKDLASACFDVVYTEGPASSYKETEFLHYTSVAAFGLGRDEYIYVIPEGPFDKARNTKFAFKEPMKQEFSEDGFLRFGEADRGVFVINLEL